MYVHMLLCHLHVKMSVFIYVFLPQDPTTFVMAESVILNKCPTLEFKMKCIAFLIFFLILNTEV